MPVAPDTAAAHRDTPAGTVHCCSTGCAAAFDAAPGGHRAATLSHR